MKTTCSACSPTVLYFYTHPFVLVGGNILIIVRRFGTTCFAIIAVGAPSITSHKMLWQIMCRFYDVLFGKIFVPSHDTFCVTNFRDMSKYFFNDELVLVSIFYFICLSLRTFLWVSTVTIRAWFLLKARCFRCTVKTDDILNSIFKYFEVVVSHCEYYVWPKYFGPELVVGRFRDSFGFEREYT